MEILLLLCPNAVSIMTRGKPITLYIYRTKHHSRNHESTLLSDKIPHKNMFTNKHYDNFEFRSYFIIQNSSHN